VKAIYSEIKSDRQIWKFSLYGFFKNLRFFEPYLLLFMLHNDLSLLKIGFLFSIKEFIVYFFEIPSGLIADKLGNRNELVSCFVFYIFSFLIFAISHNFMGFAAAMILYGLGDAFRSGTHKSIIMSYLEKRGWFGHKTFVYGRTRSFSLLGSAVSAILSVLILWFYKDIYLLFYVSIIPYIIDFLLILSYPKELDLSDKRIVRFKDFFSETIKSLKSIWKQKYSLKIVLSSATFEGIFKTIKDYIQPILKILIATNLTFLIFKDKSNEENLNFLLGITYFTIYIISSVSSKNAFRLNFLGSSAKIMNSLFWGLSVSCFFLFFASYENYKYLVVIVFIVLNILQNIRKPFFVDLIGDHLKKQERATVLSIESQLKSILIIILAPIVGYIADMFGMEFLFLFLSFLALLFVVVLKL